jgi:hypothetical protein
MPPADFRWRSFRSALIDTTAAAGQVISVQTCYHPGWHATANGRAAEVVRDGLGFLLIRPDCRGPCRIELTYNGGLEYIACRALRALTAIGVVWFWWAGKRVTNRNSPSDLQCGRPKDG